MSAAVPGLPLVPLVAPCDECEGTSEFVPGSVVEGCTCGIEPSGTHLVRRCPAGHEGATHFVADVFVGEGGSLEVEAGDAEERHNRLNLKIPPRTHARMVELAKESGTTIEKLAAEAVEAEYRKATRRALLDEKKRSMPSDVRKLFEQAELSPEQIDDVLWESSRVRRPVFDKSMPVEEARKLLGRRPPGESLLVEPAFRAMEKPIRKNLADDGVDIGLLDSVEASETVTTIVRGFQLLYNAEDQSQVLSSLRILMDGEREFRLSPAIAESLLMTEVKGVDASDLKLPYRSFIVRIPPLIPARRSDGWTGYTTSVMVTEWRVTQDFWNAEKSGAEKSGGKSGGEEARALMFFAMCGFSAESKTFSDATSGAWMCLLRGDLDVVPNSVALTDGKNIPDPTRDHPLRLVTRLVINTILYASLPSSDVVLEGQEALNRLREQARKHPRGSYKKERAQAALREAEGKPQIRKVGWSIKVPSYVREAALHEHSARGRAFTASWLVRGHWRRQAVGIGRTERKLVHIAPHYCRKDLGARLAPSPYVVK